MLDIDGLGATYVNALVDSGGVTDIADLCMLTHEQVAVAPVIVQRLADLAPVVDKLIAAGVNMTEPVEAGAVDGPLAEKAESPARRRSRRRRRGRRC
ncbi:hypothetical protein ACIO3O_36645 [Streptomyces sp. NPDC087440]|uniref:hypothetical protein n=1 Tax=Streptomyces sp. NPDC087440 TaxID=3365790 RepID=UPI00382E3C3C